MVLLSFSGKCRHSGELGRGRTLRRAPVTKKRDFGSCHDMEHRDLSLWTASVHLCVPMCRMVYLKPQGCQYMCSTTSGATRTVTARHNSLQEFHTGGVLGLHPVRRYSEAYFEATFSQKEDSLFSDFYYKSLRVAKLYPTMFLFTLYTGLGKSPTVFVENNYFILL